MKEGCRKKSFETIDEARIRLTEIIINSSKEVKPIRVYKCLFCGKYHLTSKTKEDYGKNRNKQRKIREREFIRVEAEYWEEKFKN